MAERSDLELEVQEIFNLVDSSKNFILSGGAGSGKTYSLVQVIIQAIKENPSSKIACMTYTNAAVKEIEERVNHQNLSVSTIHDFLWDNMKHFQSELKTVLLSLILDPDSTVKAPTGVPVEEENFEKFPDGIQYKEYVRIHEGIISHDEVLVLASHMFKSHVKLCDILKDRFSFIFVDEYQDTSKYVVEILLNYLNQSHKKNIIGFFGDSMQCIYDDGIGNLNEYLQIEEPLLFEVKKKQNRRNPQRIITLANLLRTDGLEQEPSKDNQAPNMINGKVKEGNVKFYYSNNANIENVKTEIGWDYKDTTETKILNLTHNLIAPKAGFKELMEIYDKDKIIDYRNRVKKYIKDNDISIDTKGKTFGEVIRELKEGKDTSTIKKIAPTKGMQEYIDIKPDIYTYAIDLPYEKFLSIYLDKDQLLDDKKQDAEEESKKGSKRDDLIKHLFKIETNISLYKNGFYNEFIRASEYRIASITDKQRLRQKIDSLIEVGDQTIEEIINKASDFGICRSDDRLNRFIQDKEYVYNRVKNVKYTEFQNLFLYLEGYTPYSTQHKTKGAEFNNVLVVMDNGKWNKYNFENLFIGNGTPSVLERTQKIFYVCCTRTKENLAIFFHQPSDPIIEKAKEWFGIENIKELV
jgi:DNA helicase-2/ATP-dependent DNA helicase PcrA